VPLDEASASWYSLSIGGGYGHGVHGASTPAVNLGVLRSVGTPAIFRGLQLSQNSNRALVGYGDALDAALRYRNRIQRSGWNGKGMFVFYLPEQILDLRFNPRNGQQPAADFSVKGYATSVSLERSRIILEPHLVMYTADHKFVPWLCSQTDALVKDWIILEYGELA
jgi:hypothetical protein